MNEHRQLITQALAATEVVSSTSHAWFGTQSQSLPPETTRLMGADSAREYLLYNLQARLYTDFYCAGGPRQQLGNPALEMLPGHSPFVRALSEANTGTGAREPGWTVRRADGDALVVSRGGLSVWAPPGEVYPADGNSLAPGAPVGVLMPKELLRLSPGFYMALGDVAFPVDGTVAILRFYWNLRSEAAPALIAALTSRLNAECVPFRLKVASEPGSYSRCDAGVLYAQRDEYERVRGLVAEVYEGVAPMLKPTTPALTKQLMPGLGLAEDPGEAAMSFGMSRCRLLAEAIVEAAERGVTEPSKRLEVVGERFAREGLSLDTPYLNRDSVDLYGFAGG
ncbi:MAG: T3SS effector HopA1 family protein [Solirubrobacteraceae bacterium]